MSTSSLIPRRDCLAWLGAFAVTSATIARGADARAAESSSSQSSSSQSSASQALNARAFAFETPEGSALALRDLAGKPVLVVNTATRCGLAPQFEGLEGLWTRFGGRGLTVIAVPSPDFGNQEPLKGAAIAEAARKDHGVTFPVVEKTHVRGPEAHPFYRWAAAEKPGETPQWNFHKYLVGRDGSLSASFSSTVSPTDPRIISAIVAELGA